MGTIGCVDNETPHKMTDIEISRCNYLCVKTHDTHQHWTEEDSTVPNDCSQLFLCGRSSKFAITGKTLIN